MSTGEHDNMSAPWRRRLSHTHNAGLFRSWAWYTRGGRNLLELKLVLVPVGAGVGQGVHVGWLGRKLRGEQGWVANRQTSAWNTTRAAKLLHSMMAVFLVCHVWHETAT